MEAAGKGKLKHWELHERPLLALIILLDQYPRILYRGTSRVFEHDAVAKGVALRAIDSGVRH